MSAEHKRPLAAFILVALACAFVVGQAVRTAAVQQLVNAGIPLTVLAPIAPDMLFTVDLSAGNGRAGDTPYVGRALVAVARTAPAPATAATTTTTTTVASLPTATVEPAVRTVAARSVHDAGRHPAPAKHAARAAKPHRTAPSTSGGATPTLSPGKDKHTAKQAAAQDRTSRAATRATVRATERQARHAERASQHRAKHQAQHHGRKHPAHQAKAHHAKAHDAKAHDAKKHHAKKQHTKRH